MIGHKARTHITIVDEDGRKESVLVTDHLFQPAKKNAVVHAQQIPHAFEVETLEGIMQGKPDDYLMRGVKGELYPCAKAVFESSYEWVK